MTKTEKVNHWRTIIQKHTESGSSAAAFCREHNLSIHQFHWWNRRFKKKESQNQETGFMKLVPFSKSRTNGIRIRLNDDVFIEVEPGFEPQILRAVIEAICGTGTTQCLR
jgi:hypothetical protein